MEFDTIAAVGKDAFQLAAAQTKSRPLGQIWIVVRGRARYDLRDGLRDLCQEAANLRMFARPARLFQPRWTFLQRGRRQDLVAAGAEPFPERLVEDLTGGRKLQVLAVVDFDAFHQALVFLAL